MSKTMIMDHPLVQHKVSLLRNKNTGTKEFKELVCELATLLCYEATRDLPTEEVEIETPIAVAKTRMLSGRKLALVPILRAGLGISACTATKRRWSLWNTTASCPMISPSAKSSFWTRCSPPAAAP